MTPLWRAVELVTRVVTAAGLAVDAYVHADLAGAYDQVGNTITEGMLFRIEAGLAAFAALVLVLTGHRLAYLLAFLVAGTAFAVIMIYRYVDVGAIGPVPQMYEPVWFTEKTRAAVAEGVATLTALIGLLLPRRKPDPA